MTTVNDLLDALNDLNAEGRIQYEDYSYLHDLAAMIEPGTSDEWEPVPSTGTTTEEE